MGIIYINAAPTYHIGSTSALDTTKNKRLKGLFIEMGQYRLFWKIMSPYQKLSYIPLEQVSYLPVGLQDQLNHSQHCFSHQCNAESSLQIHRYAFLNLKSHKGLTWHKGKSVKQFISLN